MAGSSFGRVASTPSGKKTSFNNTKRSATKRNSSILSFFKKTDGPPKSDQPRITQFGVRVVQSESQSKSKNGPLKGDNQSSGGLFLEDRKRGQPKVADDNNGDKVEDDDTEWFPRERSKTPDDAIWGNPDSPIEAGKDPRPDNEERFNENGGPVKRRKIDSSGVGGGANSGTRRRQGPFIDESDSEEEGIAALRDFDVNVSPPVVQPETKDNAEESTDNTPVTAKERSSAVERPSLVREATSNVGDDRDDAVADDSDGIEDELEGEDFLEGPWMEEENTAGLDEDDKIMGWADDSMGESQEPTSESPTCPVCEAGLGGMSASVSNWPSIGE
jgi:DNA cross-link repair 1A protein